MENIDVNEFLNLPKLDDISLDYCYSVMPLSLYCKKLGISVDEFMEDSK